MEQDVAGENQALTEQETNKQLLQSLLAKSKYPSIFSRKDEAEVDELLKQKKHAELNNIKTKEEYLLEIIYRDCEENDVEGIINCIDEFGWKYWMMNLGDGAKVQVLDQVTRSLFMDRAPETSVLDTVVRLVDSALVTSKHENGISNASEFGVSESGDGKIILELGAYCGYSALRFAQMLGKYDTSGKSMLYSVEKNSTCNAISTAVITHAGQNNKVKFFCGTIQTKIEALKKRITQDFPDRHNFKVDLIFLDHYKNAYLPDLQFLEESGLIQKDTIICADNVIYPGAPQYLEYVRNHPNYIGTFYEGNLEYCDDEFPRKDGIEISVRV